jgi:hypothetical protein
MLRAEDSTRRELMSHGLLSADDVADATVRGLQANEFFIFPHPQVTEFMRRRADDHARWLQSMRLLHAQARNN